LVQPPGRSCWGKPWDIHPICVRAVGTAGPRVCPPLPMFHPAYMFGAAPEFKREGPGADFLLSLESEIKEMV